MSPQTLTVLLKVDRTIVDSYYTQFMKIGLALSAPDEQEEASRRLLQVVAVLHSQDGESYAHGLKNLIFSLNTSTGGKDRILQGVVEDTLTFLRAGKNLNHIFRYVPKLPQCSPGRIQEWLFRCHICTSYGARRYFKANFACHPFCPGLRILGKFSCSALRYAARICFAVIGSWPYGFDFSILWYPPYRLSSAAIQDACLLSMIRIAEPCDAIPEQVVGIVRKVQEQAGRHIMTVSH